MYNLYKGKVPCAGCGRTGEEKPRYSKDSLCMDCQQALEIGRAIAKDRNRGRGFYSLDGFVATQMTWYTIHTSEIDTAMRELLRGFSSLDSKYAGYGHSNNPILGEIGAVCGHDTFVLPTEVYDAAKRLCEVINKVSTDIEREKSNYKELLNKQLLDEKNQIYNEGVEHGRNLLMQLNSGEIGSDDFNKPIKRY